MKLPRDLSGEELARLLGRLGYQVTRQTGSHMRLTRMAEVEHRISIPKSRDPQQHPRHGALKDVAEHLKISKDKLVQELWGGGR